MKPVKERGVVIRNPHTTQRNNLVKCPKCSMSLFNEELCLFMDVLVIKK